MNAPALLEHHAELAQRGYQPTLHEIAARRREAQPARMAELAELIRVELRAGVEHAVHAGALLIDAKRVVDHGNWLPWLRENFGLSERSAQNYMKLSREMAAMPAANAKRVALLPLREALESIAESRRTDLHPATGEQTQTAAPKPSVKITLKTDIGRGHDHPGGGGKDGGVQLDHGKHVADDTDHGVDDSVQVQVLAALRDAWDEATPETRERFLITARIHDEIMRIVAGRKGAS